MHPVFNSGPIAVRTRFSNRPFYKSQLQNWAKMNSSFPVHLDIRKIYYCVEQNFSLKFEVMMTTTMTITAILCVTPCALVEIYWHFRWFCLLHHQFLSFRFLFHYHISPSTIQQNSSNSRTVQLLNVYIIYGNIVYEVCIVFCTVLILHIYRILYILYVYGLFYILLSFSKMFYPWNIYIYIYLFIYLFIYLYMCVCMCLCVYIHIYIYCMHM